MLMIRIRKMKNERKENITYLLQMGSFKSEKLHALNSIEKVSHILKVLNRGVCIPLCSRVVLMVKSKGGIVHNFENSTGVDFVENVAENEAVSECEAEFFFGGFWG